MKYLAQGLTQASFNTCQLCPLRYHRSQSGLPLFWNLSCARCPLLGSLVAVMGKVLMLVAWWGFLTRAINLTFLHANLLRTGWRTCPETCHWRGCPKERRCRNRKQAESAGPGAARVDVLSTRQGAHTWVSPPRKDVSYSAAPFGFQATWARGQGENP